MNILAIDTSSKYLSVGIILEGQIVSTTDICAKLRTSNIIIPTIDKLLKKYKLKLDDFDAFCIGLGPGSFTGLRIGISTIKAFGLCAEKKIIGIPSLDIIALNAKTDANICAVVDAKRNLLYFAFYKIKDGVIVKKSKIKLLDIDSVIGYDYCRGKACLSPTYFLGDGVVIYKDKITSYSKNNIILDEAFWYPKAKNLCLLAKERFKNKRFLSLERLRPLYLYPKDCQIRK